MFHYLRAGDTRRAGLYLAADLPEEAAYRACLTVASEIARGRGDGAVEWVGELIWADGFDDRTREAVVRRLRDGVCPELARAGCIEEQATVLQLAIELWRTQARRDRRATAAHLAWGQTALQLGHALRALGRREAASVYQEGTEAIGRLRGRPALDFQPQRGRSSHDPFESK
jgi:hypothetical protein